MFRTDKTNGESCEPTLDEFIAWLETKEPDLEFEYINVNNCACAQFAAATGRRHQWLTGVVDGHQGIWRNLNSLSYFCAYDDDNGDWGNHTFGKLLKFAKEAKRKGFWLSH